MNTPIVEKGISITPRNTYGLFRTLLLTMEVGDSFLVEEENTRNCILRLNGRDKKGTKMKVISRKVNGKGYRIWRVE